MHPLLTRVSRFKAFRFAVVGVVNSLIDLAVFALAIKAGAPALLANLVGWAVAVSFSYFANSRWSFERDRSLGDMASALRFVSSGALITLGVSSGVIALLSGTVGVMPAKIGGLVLAAIVNFFAARWSIENRVV